jgi:hypothetical protein
MFKSSFFNAKTNKFYFTINLHFQDFKQQKFSGFESSSQVPVMASGRRPNFSFTEDDGRSEEQQKEETNSRQRVHHLLNDIKCYIIKNE